MIHRKLIFLPLACLCLSMLVKYGYDKKQVNWNYFFLAPQSNKHQLLEPEVPLERTKEISQKMQGKGSKPSHQPYLFFKAMASSIKKQQDEVETKKEAAVVQDPSFIQPAQLLPAEPKKGIKHQSIPPSKSIQQKEAVDYFPVAFQRSKSKVKSVTNAHFIAGYIDGTQTVKHGRSLKVRTNKHFCYQGETIPKGAMLYGKVAFGKERILVKLETATWKNQAVPIEVMVYDVDYMQDLLAENLFPFMEASKDRLLHQAVASSRNRWLKAVSQTAVDAIQSMKKEPKVTLENKRKVFLKPILKKK